ncbi:DUF1294 domain-containing protein [Glaciihabitans sp. dw_435]|uniref:DUF1294 domain-containing protein n=1 Tax=Glaciihabitans sp. dw_435 TaxID=2720081 RepID=UPI0027DE6051|nr:DUF1294 domain-containing protein [Glaciihabitans sp. dw_435]
MRSAASRSRRISGAGAASYLAIVVLLVVYGVILAHRALPIWVAGVYIVASVVCFVLYAMDKSAAVAGRRRISEKTLHLVAMAGGWPGAIVAQQTLRHKTVKRSFRWVFWITVAVNLLVLVALGWPLVPVP